MLRHRSILVVLLASLLIAGDRAAASPRAAPQLQVYLPQMRQSVACLTTSPPARALVLPAQPLAFISSEDIWLYHASTRNLKRITQNAAVLRFAWSPDATRIAFSTRTVETNFAAIKVVRLADLQVTPLISWNDGVHNAYNVSWSPDSRRIAFDVFFSDGTTTSGSVMVMQADGTQVKQLSGSGDHFAPAWSPDGRQIAFVSARRSENTATLSVMQPDGSNVTPLTDGLMAASTVAWSPDGKRLLFNGNCTVRAGGLAGLFTIAADGSGRTAVATPTDAPPYGNGMAQWSPDGRLIVYWAMGRRYSLFIAVTIDGSGYQILPLGNGYQPTWAPR
jgi:Tol biopolymer transport system component